jgi:DNA polymerase sigma
VYNLHNVVYLLRKKGFAEVFGIYNASTPIAKFKDPTRPGIEVDVNVNDLGGWSVDGSLVSQSSS